MMELKKQNDASSSSQVDALHAQCQLQFLQLKDLNRKLTSSHEATKSYTLLVYHSFDDIQYPYIEINLSMYRPKKLWIPPT
jgi:hypothetical protein